MSLFAGLSFVCLSLALCVSAASYPPTVLTSDSQIIATGCTDPVCYASKSTSTASGDVATSAVS